MLDVKNAIWIVFMISAGRVAYCQDAVVHAANDSCYNVLNSVFRKSEKVIVLRYPIVFSSNPVSENLLLEISKRFDLSIEEVKRAIRQSEFESKIYKFQKIDLKNVQVVRSFRFRRGVYGLSKPVFLKNREIALVRFMSLGPSVYESIVIYRKNANGIWIEDGFIYSYIGS